MSGVEELFIGFECFRGERLDFPVRGGFSSGRTEDQPVILLVALSRSLTGHAPSTVVPGVPGWMGAKGRNLTRRVRRTNVGFATKSALPSFEVGGDVDHSLS